MLACAPRWDNRWCNKSREKRESRASTRRGSYLHIRFDPTHSAPCGAAKHNTLEEMDGVMAFMECDEGKEVTKILIAKYAFSLSDMVDRVWCYESRLKIGRKVGRRKSIKKMDGSEDANERTTTEYEGPADACKETVECVLQLDNEHSDSHYHSLGDQRRWARLWEWPL